MAEQLELFRDNTRHITPRDTHVVPEERPRLTGQNARILEALRRRRCSNRELAAISLKYTARISDIRAKGYEINVVEHDRKSGIVIYELGTQARQ